MKVELKGKRLRRGLSTAASTTGVNRPVVNRRWVDSRPSDGHTCVFGASSPGLVDILSALSGA
jgi:hypothetical protein